MPDALSTICATNMPFAEEAFSTLGPTRVLPARTIGADDVRDADILAIRSTTKADADLLTGSRVKFVGTATIGIDHLDTSHFDNSEIGWCSAPGCNANSVSEYLTAALLRLSHEHGITLAGKTIGVVGVGNVGSKVVAKARALGMDVLMNDPPRREKDDTETFVNLAALLAESDIVTLHVPLTDGGPHATRRLADRSFFERMRSGSIFINAARGPVMDTEALIQVRESGRIAHAIIDTWEDEPSYSPDLMAQVALGTPHIAGHSYDGKVAGTVMVFEAACRHFGITSDWSVEPLLPAPIVPHLSVDATGREAEDVLHEIVSAVYDIAGDDQRLRATATASPEERSAQFDDQRKNYPIRREFRFTKVDLTGATPELTSTIRDLGFQV